MHRYPFFLLLVAFVAGILCAPLAHGILLPLSLMAIALGLYFILLKVSRSPMSALRTERYHRWWPVLLFLGFGMLVEVVHRPSIGDLCDDSLPEYAIGKIEQRQTKEYGDRLVVTVEALESADGTESIRVKNIKAVVTTNGTMASKGDRIRFPRKFKPIDEGVVEPEMASVIESMKKKNILYKEYVNGKKIEYEKARGMSGFFSRVQESIAINIENSSLSRRCIRLLNTCMLGLSEDILPDERATYSDAGISHVLALSGLHVGIVATIILFLLMPLNLIGYRRVRYIAAIVILWLFTLTTGMLPSAVRASVMLTFCLVAAAIERKNVSVNSLCAAVLLILVFDPHAIWSVGLQLSAITVACILLIMNKIPEKVIKHKVWGNVVSLAAVSVVAVAGSWTLTAMYFHSFSYAFLPVNLIVVPLMAPFIGCGMFYVLLLSVGIDFELLSWILSAIAELISWIAGYASELAPALRVDIPMVTVAAWFGALAFLVVGLHKKSLLASVASAMLAIFSVGAIWLFPAGKADGFIVDHDGRETIVHVYVDGDKETVYMPSKSISRLQKGSADVVFIDMALDDNLGRQRKCGTLIVGNGFKGSIKEAAALFEPEIVVVASGVYRKKREKIKAEATEHGIPLHCVTEEGRYASFR